MRIDPIVHPNIHLYGCPYNDGKYPLTRLPRAKMMEIIKENVSLEHLSYHTSGMAFEFTTDAKELILEVSYLSASMMSHMPKTAESGFDLYVSDDMGLHFLAVSMPSMDHSQLYTFHLKNDQKYWTYILYLPLYNGIRSMMFELPEGHDFIAKDKSYTSKILIYGTSITQGACASRPGLSYTARLSRMLQQEIINYGFSGNGLGETSVVETMCGIDDLSMIIIDYEANAGAVGRLIPTFEPMINALRCAHPLCPIVVLGRIPNRLEKPDDPLKQRRQLHQRHMKKVLKKYEMTYFISGDRLLPKTYVDTTVDGIHLNDHGFAIFTKHLYHEMQKLKHIHDKMKPKG